MAGSGALAAAEALIEEYSKAAFTALELLDIGSGPAAALGSLARAAVGRRS